MSNERKSKSTAKPRADRTEPKVLIQALQKSNIELGQSLTERTAELQQSVDQVKQLTEALANLDEGVVITDDELDRPAPRIRFVNDAICRIAGYSPDELIGKTPRVLQGEETERAALDHLKAELSAGHSCRVEVTNYRKDGTPYNAELFVTPLFDAAGRRTNFISIHRDITERKRAEESLRKSEQRFQDMADAAPVLIWMSGLDRGCVWFNKQWLEFVGRSMQQELGSGWSQHVHPEDFDRCLATYTTSFDARQPFSMEYRLRRHDGEYRWVLDQGVPQYEAGEQFTGYIGSCIDITDRKTAEQAMRQSESRLAAEATALARLNDAASRLWRQHDLREGLVEILSATIEMLGADFGNIQLLEADRGVLVIATQHGFPKDFLDFFREVSVKDDSACGRALRSGERSVIEDVESDAPYAPYREIARAAGYRSVQSTPLVAVSGTALGMISTHWRSPHRPSEQDLRRLDLYARQAAEFIERCRTDQALRDREERLRSILNTAADAIITIDLHGIIVGVNPTTERMFGYTQQELLGQNVKMLMPPPYRDQHDTYLARYLITHQPRIIGSGREVAGLRKDGSTFPIDLAVSEVENVGFTGIVRDITERKELEQQLVEIVADERRRIGQELHDGIGQELTGLSLTAGTIHELLQRCEWPSSANAAGSPDVGAMFQQACAAVDRMRESLNATSRHVQSLSRGILPVPIDSEGLRASLDELAASIHKPEEIVCRLDCPATIKVSDNDLATHLFRIAQEAVHNAVKHAHARLIRITLRVDDGTLILEVSDNGIGLTPPSSSATNSSGAGLRIMQHRASLIGATLHIEPAAEGGTAVRCCLPLTNHT